ncbi:alpha/beta hydrolase [Halarchaeum sp. P4]|uniref:alpha/beta hydrolase n=1 Tax=Halarchaeum sp. P4 TaxID=3421639 RepID=UPI003EC088C6
MDIDDIHPDARAVLERRRSLGLGPLHELGVRRVRFLQRLTEAMGGTSGPAVAATTDMRVPGPDGDIDVRAYRPEGDGPYPTVVFFHGGGFVFGSIETHDALCRALATESDSVVLSVDYRLAPEDPFPAAVEDAYAATAWAADNPEKLRSTGELSVVGDSAGGTLAAVVALMAAEREAGIEREGVTVETDVVPDIDRQALLYPGVGVAEGQESVEEFGGLVLTQDDLEWFRDCYYGDEATQRHPYADPIHADDFAGVAPATVLTAGFDPLRDGGRAYAAKLVGDGVDTTFEEFDDMIHGFATEIGRIERAQEAVEFVAADLP